MRGKCAEGLCLPSNEVPIYTVTTFTSAHHVFLFIANSFKCSDPWDLKGQFHILTCSLRVELYDIDHTTIKYWPKNNLSNGAAGSVNRCTESTIK